MMVVDHFEVGVQNYYQRLADHGLIPQSRASEESSSPSSDLPSCPICSHRLIACRGCSIVTCDTDGQCAGADLVTFVSCHMHVNEKFCPACLTDEHSGALIQCVYCRNWNCPMEMRKCVGRPDPLCKPGRIHAPKTISCWLCFPTTVMRNCSRSDCWSYTDSCNAICSDCVGSMDGHIACPCGWAWICGACAQDSGGHCPGCQTFYCLDACGYIHACLQCHKLTLCNDCMEEDLSDEESSSKENKGVIIVTTCDECGRGVCADCFEECEFCCRSCNSVRCSDCMDKCSGCEALMCSTCIECGTGCQECKVCRFSNNRL
ncbi:uncharacterized protein EDB91DRAFT_1161359 [Suillus paluster]|uniref:uncharacterized protein n=1 Tax=Suillus paluster TaxID=48578 RepID=UPI001B86CB67|nr:uncharacterized protein EDB91DRAFT_1161359 [Suillus paluster]KAG1728625.1 hypothetical protein EDB91DRAFT_1161359 [Suillus paluster]